MHQRDLIIGPWGSFNAALRDDVLALGGATRVGAWFTKKSQDAQRNYVNDRLSADRRGRFKQEQIELIMRRAVELRGFSAAHYYLCDSIGAQRPGEKDPESERDRAKRAFITAADKVDNATKELRHAMQELDRLGVDLPPLRSAA
jgi:ATP phosphoribosyltransferase regulatory subunit HisZ